MRATSGRATTGIFLLSVGATVFGLYVALVLWLILLPAVRIALDRRHRHTDAAEAPVGRAP
jgi:hypothetical protein